MSASTITQTDELARLDQSGITREHWKILFISGMGFFTDAYDLFIIGVAMHLIKEQWQTMPLADGLVTSTALLASALGALLFGVRPLGDVSNRARYQHLHLSTRGQSALCRAC